MINSIINLGISAIGFVFGVFGVLVIVLFSVMVYKLAKYVLIPVLKAILYLPITIPTFIGAAIYFGVIELAKWAKTLPKKLHYLFLVKQFKLISIKTLYCILVGRKLRGNN